MHTQTLSSLFIELYWFLYMLWQLISLIEHVAGIFSSIFSTRHTISSFNGNWKCTLLTVINWYELLWALSGEKARNHQETCTNNRWICMCYNRYVFACCGRQHQFHYSKENKLECLQVYGPQFLKLIFPNQFQSVMPIYCIALWKTNYLADHENKFQIFIRLGLG